MRKAGLDPGQIPENGALFFKQHVPSSHGYPEEVEDFKGSELNRELSGISTGPRDTPAFLLSLYRGNCHMCHMALLQLDNIRIKEIIHDVLCL